MNFVGHIIKTMAKWVLPTVHEQESPHETRHCHATANTPQFPLQDPLHQNHGTT